MLYQYHLDRKASEEIYSSGSRPSTEGVEKNDIVRQQQEMAEVFHIDNCTIGQEAGSRSVTDVVSYMGRRKLQHYIA